MRKNASGVASQWGYSLLELLTTMAIFGILAAAGIPHLDTRRQDLNNAVTTIIADIRYARARAITSGTHYAMKRLGASQYQVQRFEEVGGVWSYDSPAKTVQLPSYITITLSPATLEFNTRGMMVTTFPSGSFLTLTIKDTKFDAEHTVTVWPSGQVYYDS